MWVCQPCLNLKKTPKTEVDVRLDKLLGLIPLVKSLHKRMESLEEGMGKKLDEKIEEVVDRKLEELMDEKMEIDKRRNNLILVNLKESAKTEIEERKKERKRTWQLLNH